MPTPYICIEQKCDGGSLTCRFYGRARVTHTDYNFGRAQREKALFYFTQRATRITRRHDAEFYGCLISKFIQDEQAHAEFSSNNRTSLLRQQTFSWQLDFPPKEPKLNFLAFKLGYKFVSNCCWRLWTTSFYIHLISRHSAVFQIILRKNFSCLDKYLNLENIRSRYYNRGKVPTFTAILKNIFAI